MTSSSYIMRNKPVLFFYSFLLHYLWFYRPLFLAPLHHFSKPQSSLFSFLLCESPSTPLIISASHLSLLWFFKMKSTEQHRIFKIQVHRDFCRAVMKPAFYPQTLLLGSLMFALPFSSPLSMSQWCLQHLFHDWNQHFKSTIVYM